MLCHFRVCLGLGEGFIIINDYDYLKSGSSRRPEERSCPNETHAGPAALEMLYMSVPGLASARVV